MTNSHYSPQSNSAYHILRVSLAIMMLLHGAGKLTNGISGIENMIAGTGLPAFFAYGVYIGEVAAPILLLGGFFVAPAALIIAINMVVAVFLVHTHQIAALTNSGGWAIELQAFFFITAIAVALLAPGRNRQEVHRISSYTD